MLCSLNLDADAKALLKTASCCSADTKKKQTKKQTQSLQKKSFSLEAQDVEEKSYK